MLSNKRVRSLHVNGMQSGSTWHGGFMSWGEAKLLRGSFMIWRLYEVAPVKGWIFSDEFCFFLLFYWVFCHSSDTVNVNQDYVWMAYFRILKKSFPETSRSTVPETNIAPETPGLEDELVFRWGRPPARCYISFSFKKTFQSIPAPEGTETWALALQGWSDGRSQFSHWVARHGVFWR